MKLFAVVALLGLVGAAYASLDPAYVLKAVELAQQNNEVFDEASARPSEARSERATWLCSGQTSTGKPSSVHALKPVDVEVLTALGDSLTAANGAKASSILGLLDECRGVSWSMGCESAFETRITFATMLKKYAPGLVGCSTGTGGVNTSVANLNIAQPGHTSHETLQQARLLVSRLSTTVADYQNKWKVLNYFIGGNDLCKSCKDAKYSAANYVKNIQDTLDYVRANMPRTLVNLVLTLDVTGIRTLTGTTCRNMQTTFCDCALAADGSAALNTLYQLTKDYQAGVENLIASGRYDNDDLFTVVLHPFMKFMKPPTLANGNADYSYFAPDCFHFSVKGHEAAAVELWNAMLTPVGQKTTAWNLGQAIKCPSVANPFIFTNKNSKNYVDTSKLKDLLMKN